LAVNNLFGAVNIGQINSNGGVFIGHNNQANWDTHQNRKPAVGMVNGYFNNQSGNLVSYMDNDLIDMPVNEIENVPSANPQIL